MRIAKMQEGSYYRELLGVQRTLVRISRYMGPVKRGRTSMCRMKRPDGTFSIVPSSSIEREATEEEVNRAYPS
tara:strand:+ start:648 stop:866 length:219 start_codon:yes stop_codon:yes gene_type:complete